MHLSIDANRTTVRRLGSAGLAAVLLATLAGQALAHEERDVAGYSFEVGLIAEPVFVGDRSGLEFHVTKDDKPISGLDQTIKAQVTYGTQTRDLPLVEREEDPGWYESVFIPTAAGKYTFHLTGSIHGQVVDATATSSDSTFDSAIEPTAIQFPAPLPALSQMLTRLDRLEARLSGADASAQPSPAP